MKPILIFVLLITSGTVNAQNPSPDYNTFLKQTQISNSNDGRVDIAWWIPTEFWKIALRKQPDVTEEQIDNVIQLLEPYVIFAIVDAKTGEFGDFIYTSFDSLENKVSAIGNNGKTIEPLAYDELSVGVQSLLSMVKPILKNAMGQLGENMHFFVFEDISKKNKRNFDPMKVGLISVKVVEKKYEWKTPVHALLPLKKCPEDNVELNGAWSYCPFHGNKLITQ